MRKPERLLTTSLLLFLMSLFFIENAPAVSFILIGAMGILILLYYINKGGDDEK